MPCLQGSGSHAEGPANSSSLLFSWTGVNSFVHLAFHGLSESIFSFFMEGNAIHRNLFHAAVIQPVAFAQEIGARLRIRNHKRAPISCAKATGCMTAAWKRFRWMAFPSMKKEKMLSESPWNAR